MEVHKNDYNVTSDFIERSVDKDTVVIQEVISQLCKAGLIQIVGSAGVIKLINEPKATSLLQVYNAITPLDNTKIFRFDTNQRKKCSMRRKVCALFTGNFNNKQEVLRSNLEGISLQQVLVDLNYEYGLKQQ